MDLRNRTSLMASLPKGGTGVEIGVAEGEFSQVLLEVCEPKLLYLVDSWIYQPALDRDSSNVPQAHQDAKRQQVLSRFKDVPSVRIIRGFSLEVASQFLTGSLDWWHLDGNHATALADIRAWWPKLRPGGWATGHDYTMTGDGVTVKRDVDLFVTETGLPLYVTRGDCKDIYERNYPTWAIQKP